VARYGEYEEVTTGGNDRWPYARWDFLTSRRSTAAWASTPGACEGLSSAQPVLVTVPGRRLNLVRGALGEAAGAVSFADIAVLGRNPAGSSRPSAGSPIAAARAAPGSSAGVAWRASV